MAELDLVNRPRAMRDATRPRRSGPNVAAVAVLLLGLAPLAVACPSCALSQGADTLIYIAAFLVLPYVVVTGVWVWLKRLLASENEGSA